MAHTPGPLIAFGIMVSDAAERVGGWRCIQRQVETPRGRKIGDGRSIALIEGEDDAKLFAAAPELLAALERMVDDCGFIVFAQECECGENGNGFDDKGRPCEHIQAARAIAKAKGGA